jgi:hypothetical protein
MKNKIITDTIDNEAAENYSRQKNGDCLKHDNGSKLSEHIYCFCQCDIEEAFLTGCIYKEELLKK